ncbi:uncharacterized LabA/DUF88 family protein [Algoriphagus aquaeductus]|uniref:Uncharacterized LabA/DUF88 family protein n=2 Tax=Cyclobacteriaceae TaxID=563798 RepID=A0A326RJC6_9BACT|nr:uncharacterized LabA/DUF88 family protein [Algoriphagus aquaeductus]
MSFNVLTTHPNRFYPIGQKPLNEAFFISTGMKKRVSFYVDGFNFYYGLKAMTKSKPDWRKFYWINLVKLFEEFLNEDEELVCVNYFTARPKNKGKQIRQNILMNCNKALNGEKLKLHYGKYQDKEMICRADGGCGRVFMHWEEKQTDVNLAIKIVEDCHNGVSDKIVLVSGDSDFLPPIKLVEQFYKNIELMILFPPTKFTSSLANRSFPALDLASYKPKWNKAILPDQVTIEGSGKVYRKPIEWFPQ